PRAGGTDLELVQTGFAKEEFRLGHNEGWVSALDGLDPALAGAPKPTRAGPMLLGHPQSSYTRAARIAFEERASPTNSSPARRTRRNCSTSTPGAGRRG